MASRDGELVRLDLDIVISNIQLVNPRSERGLSKIII